MDLTGLRTRMMRIVSEIKGKGWCSVPSLLSGSEIRTYITLYEWPLNSIHLYTKATKPYLRVPWTRQVRRRVERERERGNR